MYMHTTFLKNRYSKDEDLGLLLLQKWCSPKTHSESDSLSSESESPYTVPSTNDSQNVLVAVVEDLWILSGLWNYLVEITVRTLLGKFTHKPNLGYHVPPDNFASTHICSRTTELPHNRRHNYYCQTQSYTHPVFNHNHTVCKHAHV